MIGAAALGKRGGKARAATPSILGMDILKYWKIYFDYPEKVILSTKAQIPN